MKHTQAGILAAISFLACAGIAFGGYEAVTDSTPGIAPPAAYVETDLSGLSIKVGEEQPQAVFSRIVAEFPGITNARLADDATSAHVDIVVDDANLPDPSMAKPLWGAALLTGAMADTIAARHQDRFTMTTSLVDPNGNAVDYGGLGGNVARGQVFPPLPEGVNEATIGEGVQHLGWTANSVVFSRGLQPTVAISATITDPASAAQVFEDATWQMILGDARNSFEAAYLEVRSTEGLLLGITNYGLRTGWGFTWIRSEYDPHDELQLTGTFTAG